MSANLQSHLGQFVVSLVYLDSFLVLGKQPHRPHYGLTPGGTGLKGPDPVSQGLLGAQAPVLCAAEVQAAGKLKHRSSKRARPRRSLRGCLVETHLVIMGLEDWGEDPGFDWLEQCTFLMKSPWDKICRQPCEEGAKPYTTDCGKCFSQLV